MKAPILLLALLGFPLVGTLFGADSVIVFNEIHYHPADEENATEWIELRSLMGVNVDISGWELEGGINYRFEEGTVVPGHGLVLVAADPAHPDLAGRDALGPFTGQLSNAGESIRLVNKSDRTMDEVDYADGGNWPVGADGLGSTLAKRNEFTADARPSNWVASNRLGGTPGTPNFPTTSDPPTITDLLTLTSEWRYRDAVSSPPADWAAPDFDDSQWPTGNGVFFGGDAQPAGPGEGLLGYWPLDQTSGTSAPNVVEGAPQGQLAGNALWFNDATRGRVVAFNGVNAHIAAGATTIPPMTLTNDFTWSFWAYDQGGVNNNVILGNRYAPNGSDFSPREFIKFTTNRFEFHRGGAGENIDYANIPLTRWVHHAVVKSGSEFTYFRDGVEGGSRTITQGTNNPQPLYFGGNQGDENWGGRLDDPAIWEVALPVSSIEGLADGSHTPLTAPTVTGGGSGNLNTELTIGSTAYYFRHQFQFAGSPSRTSLSLKLLVDDGAVVYLNGSEVYRDNLPAGVISHDTLAVDSVPDATLSSPIVISSEHLLPGLNTLAVAVHQSSADSSDMAFGGTLTATEHPPAPGDPERTLVFSEISAAGDPSFRIELTNLGSSTINLAGYQVRSSRGASEMLPQGLLPAGGHVVLSPSFSADSGDRLALLAPGGAELSDARTITGRLRGLSGSDWLYPDAPSFGAPNSFSFQSDIVINEIMYNPLPLPAGGGLPHRNSDEQWIELYNRGSTEVDLGGWRFSDGVSFEFPAGTTLEPGGFLVVARNAAALAARFPQLTIAGEWSGNLSRKGERLRLIDANRNPVDEVRFSDGGRWPGKADGGGSSLELRDPDSDNNAPEAWAPSEEGAPWQTIRYTGRGNFFPTNDPTLYHEFIFGLLDAGEFLIDDISVLEDPSGTRRELIQNGNFSTGTFARWRMRGNHRHARVVPDPDDPSNDVLHVRATGAMEHMHNHAETTLRSGGSYVTLSASKTYEISFRARWLSGSNQLNTRLYFNRMPRTTLLETPPHGGTPGMPNSRFTPNAGPTYSELIHSPAVPAAGEPVTVSVSAADPDGISGITLFYSINGGAFTSIPMTEQEEGRYAASIPGHSAGRKAQFYLSARDTLGATELIPAAGPDSRALIPWDDGQANLDYGDCQPNNFRIVMTNEDTNFLHTVTEVMSNDRLGCTIIYNESEIYYDCGVRLKGSQRGRAKDVRVGFTVGFPDNQPFLGCHETVAVDRSGAGDQFSQKEILVKHIVNHAGGIPGMEDDLIRIIAPRQNHTGSAILLKSRYDNEWLENQFPRGDEGILFEYELIYYPTSTTGGPEGDKRPNPDSVVGVPMRPVSVRRNKEFYRYHWQIDNNKDADNYEPLINMLTTLGLSGAEFREAVARDLDVDQWLRAFAVQVLCGIGDNYSSGSQHNGIFFIRPTDGKAMYFPWDMDFSFNRGTTSSLTPNGELSKLINASPEYERAYYGHLHNIITTTFNTNYLSDWANHYSCFLPTEDLTGFLSYINGRRSHAMNGISGAVARTAYRITSPDNTSTAATTITIRGDAWVDLRAIRLQGATAPLAITWTDDNSWEVTVPVSPGPNTITLEALGFNGEVMGEESLNVTGTGSLVPASAANLAISELMYHPAAPSEAEIDAGFVDQDDFEFIELQNLSEDASLDLSDLHFIRGITFQITSGTLAPGERMILAGNEAAFAFRYGGGIPVVGGYQLGDANKLSNDGERLTLLDASGTVIFDLTYNDAAPWPVSADGEGYSLILMCPGINDPSLPESWRTSSLPDGNPADSDAIPLADWMATHNVTDLLSDDDDDGLASLFEYASGTDPNLADPGHPFTVSVATEGDPFLVLSFRQWIGADELSLTGRESADLINWTNPATYHGRINNGDGTSSVLFRSTSSPNERASGFLRLEAETK